MADAIENGKKIADRFETQQSFAKDAPLKNLTFKLDFSVGSGKDKPLADGDLSTRPDQGTPESIRRRLSFVVSHPFRRKKRKGWVPVFFGTAAR